MKKILALSLFLFIIFPAFSSHFAGADIAYKFISEDSTNTTYEITLIIYRDCMGANLTPSYIMNYKSATCNMDVDFFIYKSGSPVELTSACEVSTCFGGTALGIQRQEYSFQISIPHCSDWVISWKGQYRNNVTNVSGTSTDELYIEATINNAVFTNNSSPTFSDHPLSNIVCKDQAFTFSNNAIDIDNDSIVYSLIDPKLSVSQVITYNSPFSATNPLTTVSGFNLDQNTGVVSFTPTGSILETTIIALLIEEYRNGQLIGSVIRDMQMNVRDCQNQRPQISGINGLSDTLISGCAKSNICFNLYGSDQDSLQNTTFSWDAVLLSINTPGANVTVSGNGTAAPVATFCWTPANSYAGFNSFTINIEDDGCPINLQNQKTVIIEVFEVPDIDLGIDTTVACSNPITLAPSPTGGSGSYSYLWSTGETTSTITAINGTYFVTVTDNSTGCSITDTINLFGGLTINFNASPLCLGDTTIFTDLSNSQIGNITSWDWDFGDGNFSTLQDPTNIYAVADSYWVNLSVQDDQGCSESLIMQIFICNIPQVNFSFNDTACQFPEKVDFTDLSMVDSCAFDIYTWDFGDGIVESYPPLSASYPDFVHNYQDSGFFDVTLTINFGIGCSAFLSKSIYVNPAPYVDIIEDDFYLRCASGWDTTLHVVDSGGTGQLFIEWSTSPSDTLDSLIVNSTNSYTVNVTDELECFNYETIIISNPLNPVFVYKPYCEVDDTVYFYDATFTYYGIDTSNWFWDFNDTLSGADNFSNLQDPFHFFIYQDSIYDVELSVIDKDSCSGFAVQKVYVTLPDTNFKVSPNKIVCWADRVISYFGPDTIKINNIDSYIWYFDDTQTDSIVVKFDNLTGLFNHYYYINGTNYYTLPVSTQNSTYTYIQVGVHNIKLKVIYNKVNDTLFCIREYYDSVIIRPQRIATIDVIGECYNLPIQFSLNQSQGDTNFVSWFWNFGDDYTVGDTSVEELPSYLYSDYPLTDPGFRTLTVSLTDGYGCTYSNTQFFQLTKILTPGIFYTDSICPGVDILFVPVRVNDMDNIFDWYWDFGDTLTFEDTIRTIINDIVSYLYPGEGDYIVSLIVSGGQIHPCADTLFREVHINPKPNADFSFDTACVGDITKFYDNTTITIPDSIISWKWDFGDNSISNLQNPIHLYSVDGYYNTQLITYSSNNCTDTASYQIRVYLLPVGDFYFVPDLPTSFIDMQFYDNSTPASEITYWLWSFGDGDSSYLQNPVHVFNVIDSFVVVLIVENENGCKDTVLKEIDTHYDIVLPTAFSPNNDGENDDFGILQRGIKELYEFKIYNRWGQVIFEGHTLDDRWDGTYNGKPQEVGTYIYYVSAESIYGKEFKLKGHITLIR